MRFIRGIYAGKRKDKLQHEMYLNQERSRYYAKEKFDKLQHEMYLNQNVATNKTTVR